MKKRGLSNIISIVLIVLLVLAAIAILWGFLSPILSGTGDSIVIRQKCLEIGVKPISCDIATGDVRIQLNKGQNVAQISAVLTSSGVVTTDTQNSNGIFGVTLHNFATINNGDTVQATAIILDENGQQVSCEPSPTEIICGQLSVQTQICGDSSVQTPNSDGIVEECDDGTSNGQVCTPNYDSSCNYCDSNCQAQIISGGTCGDFNIDSSEGETCDDGNTITETECPYGQENCNNFCNSDCSIQLSLTGTYCGDGTAQIEKGEECDDGNDLNGDGCSKDCKTETGSEMCGNGVIEAGEECDIGEDRTPGTEDDVTDNQSCSSAGMVGEDKLDCSEDCTLNTDVCLPPPIEVCGDGAVVGKEVCDYSGTESDISDDNLNGETCESVKGEGWEGDLACTNTCNAFDTTKCTEAVVVVVGHTQG